MVLRALSGPVPTPRWAAVRLLAPVKKRGDVARLVEHTFLAARGVKLLTGDLRYPAILELAFASRFPGVLYGLGPPEEITKPELR